MESLGSDELLKQFGTGVASNLIFVFAYLVSLCLKKKYKHSHCKGCCLEFDLERQETIRIPKGEDKNGEV